MELTFNKTAFVRTMRGLMTIRRTLAPLVMRRTMNDIAFEARTDLGKKIHERFVLRNKYTERGLYVNKATQRKIRDMFSEVGHRAGYMRTQEEGGTIRSKGKHFPIPTRQARISKSSKKLVRAIYRMQKLNVGGKIFLKKVHGKLGIFLAKRGRLVMLWDLSRSSVVIKKHIWFEPTIARLCRKNRIDKIFAKNAEILRKKYA